MRLLPIVPLVLFCSSVLAQSPDLASAAMPPPIKADPWSIVGQWRCTHPTWTDTLTIAPDGTFSRTTDEPFPAGRWTLKGQGGQVVLELAWTRWPVETVSLVTPDYLRGKVEEGDMVLRRPQPPAVKAGTELTVETRTWRQGEPPVRLIRQDEGFCALSLVTGHFQGGGEVVKVSVADDGYWYLDGQSAQEGVAAQCIVVRYPVKR